MENKFIPCSNGQQAQMECLYRIAGSLVEVVGFPMTHYTPQDARTAAQTLWAMADSIEGKNAPRIDSQAVEALVNAAWSIVRDAGDPRRLPGDIDALEKALTALTGDA